MSKTAFFRFRVPLEAKRRGGTFISVTIRRCNSLTKARKRGETRGEVSEAKADAKIMGSLRASPPRSYASLRFL